MLRKSTQARLISTLAESFKKVLNTPNLKPEVKAIYAEIQPKLKEQEDNDRLLSFLIKPDHKLEDLLSSLDPIHDANFHARIRVNAPLNWIKINYSLFVKKPKTDVPDEELDGENIKMLKKEGILS